MRAFLFYIDDWLSSKAIKMMDAHEERGLLRLLIHAWSEPDCGLPNEDSQLAVLSLLGKQWFKPTKEAEKRIGAMTSGEKLRREFFVHDGRVFNVRLLREREYQVAHSEKKTRAGKAGADARWKDGNRIATALPRQCLEDANIVSVSSLSSEEIKLPKNAGFESWRIDELFVRYRDTYVKSGAVSTDDDWTRAWFQWKVLDFHQKADAIAYVSHCDPAYAKLPQNVLKSKEWTRPQRPEPKSDVDRMLERL